MEQEQIKITAEYVDTADNLTIFANDRGYDGLTDLKDFVVGELGKIVKDIIAAPVGKLVDAQYDAARLAKRQEEEAKIAERLTIEAEII